MAYEKQTWTCGETITADKLNHMEDGIAEGGSGVGNITFFDLTYDEDNDCYTADASYNDVYQVMQNGLAVFNLIGPTGATNLYYIYAYYSGIDEYNVSATGIAPMMHTIDLTASNPTDNLSTCSGGGPQ